MFASRTNWDLTPNRFALAVESHKKAGKRLYDLTTSNPADCGIVYDPKILQSLASAEGLKYQPTAQGLLTARQAVADHYSAKSIGVRAEDIILTTSTSEVYSFIFRLLCETGDEILAPRPSYPLFEFLANIQDVNLVPYSLAYDHGWQIDLGTVQSAITQRTRAVIVVNPNNPTGSFIKANELAELNRLSQQHDLALISDEVFHDFAFDPVSKLSFASNEAALTFTLSGLSKVAGLPQMKVAWMVVSGPEKLKRAALARLDVIADTYLSMNTPVQNAVPTFLDSRHNFQKQLNSRLASNLSTLDKFLAEQKACSRLDVEGGWYAILRVPVLQTDEDLAIALVQQRDVLVHPGHFFDFQQDGYLVLSLMTPEYVFSEGLRRILNFMGRD